MSTDEQDRIVGKALRELKAAKEHLAALKAQAAALTSRIGSVASVLSDQADWSYTGAMFHVRYRQGGKEINGTWPTWDEIRSVMDEIDSTTREVAALEASRKELGV